MPCYIWALLHTTAILHTRQALRSYVWAMLHTTTILHTRQKMPCYIWYIWHTTTILHTGLSTLCYIWALLHTKTIIHTRQAMRRNIWAMLHTILHTRQAILHFGECYMLQKPGRYTNNAPTCLRNVLQMTGFAALLHLGNSTCRNAGPMAMYWHVWDILHNIWAMYWHIRATGHNI